MADRDGLGGLSMRKLAARLKVEAMSLYYHFKNKDEILDAMVDAVFLELDWPVDEVDWQRAMRQRAIVFRDTLKRHPWALGVLDSRRSPGFATLMQHEAVLANLRRAGFSVSMTGHAYAMLDAYVYGFVLQELSIPIQTEDETAAFATDLLTQMPADKFPYLIEFTSTQVLQPGYSFANEFTVGLELVLKSLATLRAS